MTKKFRTLEQALEIDQENRAKFNSLKKTVSEQVRNIFNKWAVSLFPTAVLSELKEKNEDIFTIIHDFFISSEDIAPLEFIQINISNIFSESDLFENKIEKYIKELENIGFNLDEFKSGFDFSNDPFITIGGKFQSRKDSELQAFLTFFEDEKKKILNILKLQLDILHKSCLSYATLKENYNSYIKIYLNENIKLVNNELESFRRLRNIANNAKTEDIFDNAVKKYKKLESDYRLLFYWGIALLLLISTSLFFIKFVLVPNLVSNTEFWVIKFSVIIVGITLISYFLKQSSHYQQLADQNYQTQVELQAYPSFMESIPMDEAASVRKELALKYFGRELDHSYKKDISNLLADQMKSTTEMVKASTEAIKNLKG